MDHHIMIKTIVPWLIVLLPLCFLLQQNVLVSLLSLGLWPPRLIRLRRKLKHSGRIVSLDEAKAAVRNNRGWLVLVEAYRGREGTLWYVPNSKYDEILESLPTLEMRNQESNHPVSSEYYQDYIDYGGVAAVVESQVIPNIRNSGIAFLVNCSWAFLNRDALASSFPSRTKAVLLGRWPYKNTAWSTHVQKGK